MTPSFWFYGKTLALVRPQRWESVHHMEDRNLTWGTERGLRTDSIPYPPTLTLCSLTAALPGEELLCCVCRSETVVPGNRLVSCEKCRHGERAGYLNGPACSGHYRLPRTLPTGTGPYATWPESPSHCSDQSPQRYNLTSSSAQGEAAMEWGCVNFTGRGWFEYSFLSV